MNHDHLESAIPSNEPTSAAAEQGDMSNKFDISEDVQRHHLTGLCFILVDEKNMAHLAPAARKRLECLLASDSWLVDIHGAQDIFQLVLSPQWLEPGSSENTTGQDPGEEVEKPLEDEETQVVEWDEPQAISMCLEVSDELVIVLSARAEAGMAKMAKCMGQPIQPQMVWDLLPQWRERTWLDFPTTVLTSGGSVVHAGGISLGISTKPGFQAEHVQVRTAFEAWMGIVGSDPDSKEEK